jgi:hypothetical protein
MVDDGKGGLVKRSKLNNDVSTLAALAPCLACHRVPLLPFTAVCRNCAPLYVCLWIAGVCWDFLRLLGLAGFIHTDVHHFLASQNNNQKMRDERDEQRLAEQVQYTADLAAGIKLSQFTKLQIWNAAAD